MPYIYAPTRAGAGLSHHALKQSFHPSKAVGRLVIEKLTKEQPLALLSAGERHRARRLEDPACPVLLLLETEVPGTHHRDPLRRPPTLPARPPPLIPLADPPPLLATHHHRDRLLPPPTVLALPPPLLLPRARNPQSRSRTRKAGSLSSPWFSSRLRCDLHRKVEMNVGMPCASDISGSCFVAYCMV
jgi:hypothetical protein